MLEAIIDQQTGEIIICGDQLSDSEKAHLARCEADYDRGIIQAMLALKEIHDAKLYREYGTFEDYCQQKRGFTRQRGTQIVNAASLIQDLTTIGLHGYVTNERTARALLDVDPVDRVPVLLQAVSASGGEVNSSWIKSAATVQAEKDATHGYVDDGEGSMTAGTAAVIGERYERAKRQRQHIKDHIDQQKADDGLSKLYEGYVNYHSHNKALGTLTSFVPRDTLARFDGARPGKAYWIVIYEATEDIPS